MGKESKHTHSAHVHHLRGVHRETIHATKRHAAVHHVGLLHDDRPQIVVLRSLLWPTLAGWRATASVLGHPARRVKFYGEWMCGEIGAVSWLRRHWCDVFMKCEKHVKCSRLEGGSAVCGVEVGCGACIFELQKPCSLPRLSFNSCLYDFKRSCEWSLNLTAAVDNLA